MEYTFSQNNANGTETVRTKSKQHSNLFGFQQVKQEYPDSVVFDSFRVVRKLDSKEDSAGNCYDWYQITGHYRYVDTSPRAQKAVEQVSANLDYLSMMSGVEIPGGEADEQPEI